MINLFIISKKELKRLFIFSSIIICIYGLSALMLFVKMEIPWNLIKHFIVSVIGMVGLLIINVKFPNNFVRFLTIIASTYYMFTSFGNICLSFIRDDLTAFQNMGVLNNTDNFIFLIALGYIFLINKDEEC